MRRNRSCFTISRRRFAFWVGFGLFNLAEKLGADGLDALAAGTMRRVEPESALETEPAGDSTSKPEHWRAADNAAWWWYERETMVDGQWKLTGITTPMNKKTGNPYTEKTGYLDEGLVPDDVRLGFHIEMSPDREDVTREHDHGEPNPERKARHGRPPSKWLRSLYADELRIWMGPIEVPSAGVTGMSFWTHLTRDHFFDPNKIAGLTIKEQAKLHAAAHYGY